jgi:hypothetical protein
MFQWEQRGLEEEEEEEEGEMGWSFTINRIDEKRIQNFLRET